MGSERERPRRQDVSRRRITMPRSGRRTARTGALGPRNRQMATTLTRDSLEVGEGSRATSRRRVSSSLLSKANGGMISDRVRTDSPRAPSRDGDRPSIPAPVATGDGCTAMPRTGGSMPCNSPTPRPIRAGTSHVPLACRVGQEMALPIPPACVRDTRTVLRARHTTNRSGAGTITPGPN